MGEFTASPINSSGEEFSNKRYLDMGEFKPYSSSDEYGSEGLDRSTYKWDEEEEEDDLEDKNPVED